MANPNPKKYEPAPPLSNIIHKTFCEADQSTAAYRGAHPNCTGLFSKILSEPVQLGCAPLYTFRTLN